MSDSNTQLTTTDETTEIEEATLTEVPETPGFDNPDVKELGAVDEDHHAVQEIGKSAMKKEAGSGAGKFLSEYIYEHDKAWVREWLQNHEAACVRAAKFYIQVSEEYEDGWLVLNKWVDAETGETVIDYDEDQTALAEYNGEAKNVREIAIPRPIDEVMEAARSLGYDPTIVWDVFRDERKIITTDNGDGMTPTEFDRYFNSPFESKSDQDGETGGKFGVGSESAAIVHGEDGGMEGEFRSRKPDEDGNPRPGFRAYSYLGGGNIIPGEVEDGFFGSRFLIPVQGDFNLNKLQSWVEDYVAKLRVPLLYREHDAGTTPVEEEYEATYFVDDYEDPPVVIERPGEFTVVAGPDVVDTSYHADDDDTFLVSMPIDRNTRASINTFWNTVIQIHDEQGRIVAGPHRGQYDGNVDELHEDDIVLPQPTGDRDRLSRDSKQKDFFNYVESVVKAAELEQVGEIAERMDDADHPADAIRGEPGDWTLFRKMVKYHGSRRVLETRRKFKEFIDDRDEFPDYDDETLKQVYSLFDEVSYCRRGAGMSSKKSRRTERRLGKLLSNKDPDTVYMAASTGGKFTQRFRVIENTYDNAEVIVVNGARKYEPWSKQFGFNVLKEVPLTDTDEQDHDYDVPQDIHDDNIRTGSANSGKPDEVKDRALKLRTDDDNSSIDLRLSIEDAQERLENNGRFGGHKKLLLFPRTGDENISDHYDMAAYAAIASVSKTEYEALADYDDVVTYDEFIEWSESALIATEDGAMTPGALLADDRMVILAYRPPGDHDVVQLLGDDYEQLRTYYAEDIRDQYSWAAALDGYDGGYRGDDVGEVPDDEKDDTLFAVAGNHVLKRAEWAFDQLKTDEGYTSRDITGLNLSHDKYGYRNPCEWRSLSKTTTLYKLMADTPNWDDSSDIYSRMPTRRSKPKAQMYLGFHDRGIDPSEKDAEELRDLIAGNNN